MDEINAITGQPRNVVAFPVTPRSGQCGTSLALPTSTAPSGDDDRGRFAKAMGQCLALVAPSGMAQDARRVWMEAAFAALRHLPIDVIEKGAIEAQRTADHPSKIVPAVIAATEQMMAFRRRMNAPRPQPYTPQALPSPEKVRSTESELDAICKRFGVGRYSKHDTRDPNSPAAMGKNPDRKCRAPTREDYIKLFGIDPEALSNGA